MKMTKKLFSLASFIMVMLLVSPQAMAQQPCMAAFQYTVGTTTPNGTQVSMYDSSWTPGTILNWNWTVSNGQTSTLQNPVFNFLSGGNYSVCLTITAAYQGATCTSTHCDTININTLPPACNANFNATVAPQGVTFSATGGNNASWVWSFGDGTSGSGSTVFHSYSAPGTYTACLTVVDASGVTCNSCQTVVVPSSAGCQAFFTSAQVPGTTQFNFTNQSQGNATYFAWSFGDGTSSTLQNPSHTYNGAGNYLVCLTIIDSIAGCSDSYCDTISVGGGFICDATFSFQTSPAATVFIANNQSNASYSWDFGDGTTGTTPIMTHIYSNPGTYNVCLTVTTASGLSCTSCQSVTISSGTGCSSNFAIYPDTTQPHTYIAYNLATGVGPMSYVWSWGDGSSSNTAYPSHTYAAAGTYTICLTITDATGCTNTTCYQFALLRVTNNPVTINVVQGTTGVTETNLLQSLMVAPNPATETTNVNFNILNDTEVTYSVKNLAGQTVFTSPSAIYSTGSHKIELNVADYPAGLYLLEITAGGKRSFSKILVQ